MPELAVLGLVGEYHPAYSISTVIRSQLLGLQQLGVSPVFINQERGQYPAEFTGEVRYLPDFPTQDWLGPAPVDKQWKSKGLELVPAFVEALKDVKALLANDLIMQGWYMQYRWALLQALEELPQLQVYHLVHSGPGPYRDLPDPLNCMYQVHDQESVIYNNDSDLPAVRHRYDTDRVYSVHNPLPLTDFFDMPEKVQQLYFGMDFEGADVITIYPTRLDGGKQVDKWLMMVGALKSIGVSVRAVIANSFCTSYKYKHVAEQLKEVASEAGLALNKDYCFTSEFCNSPEGLNRKEVSALNRLANVFIQTSVSETCSLIMLEAMASRQLLVLNDDLPCNHSGELAGAHALRAKFGSVFRVTQYSAGFQTYCVDVAKQVVDALLQSREQYGFLKVLKQHSNRAYASSLLKIMGIEHPRSPASRSLVDLPAWDLPKHTPIPHIEKAAWRGPSGGSALLSVVDPELAETKVELK